MLMGKYTDERNSRILIALLKAHGIRKVVANPGVRNISFTGSVQNDPWFEVYSGVDERHSAYLAVGMAAESGEPVVLSCTQATASRNYLPAMTEAFYRKVPVLAVTSMVDVTRNRQLLPQTIDQTVSPPDVYRYSVCCGEVRTDAEAAACGRLVNEAILALGRHGGGPVNINLVTSFATGFSFDELPDVKKISRWTPDSLDDAPEIPAAAKVAIFMGARRMPRDLSAAARATEAIESFVRSRSAVVFCDMTSEYGGAGRVDADLLFAQKNLLSMPSYKALRPDLIIHAGETSGSRTGSALLAKAPVWRVSEDGEIRDLRGKLEHVFEMGLEDFCRHYAGASAGENAYAAQWQDADREIRAQVPELPFSNCWIAQRMRDTLPAGARLHLGIYNSLRSWDCFPPPPSVRSSANVGGFGIDGCLSTAIGASLASPSHLVFCVLGDLSFFYDMNALGNRHVGTNVRILLVNNGTGAEFNLYRNPGAAFGERVNDFIAAGGHFGNRSERLVRHYAEDLGFKYLAASDKVSFDAALPEFVGSGDGRPMLFECFTEAKSESDAMYALEHLVRAQEGAVDARQSGLKKLIGRIIR